MVTYIMHHKCVTCRFSLIQRTGQACTALAFNIKRPTEILVALADYTVRCYDIGMYMYM